MQRPLGRTEATVSAIGQGTTKTGPWSEASPTRDRERIAALQHGFDLGLTLVDTAELYGGGHAEEVVGRAIAGRRDRVVVASKFNPEHSAYPQLLAAAEGSLRRLRTDYLDLYQLHWPEPRVPFAETVAALARLVADGKVRWVGLGNMTVTQLARALELANGLPIVSVQVEYSPSQRACEADVLPYCDAAGLTPLAYGILDRGMPVAGPRRALLERVATSYGCTPAQVMIAWVLRRPGIVALVKAASRLHVAENAAAAALRLSEEDLAGLERGFAQHVVGIPPERIDVQGAYATIEEARANPRDLVPAPVAVAAWLTAGESMKPLPVARAPDDGRAVRPYALLDGEVLYWGWVLAHGMEAPMPAFVRDVGKGGSG